MKKLIKVISAIFTAVGFYLLITGDFTNGLLTIIAGELIDMPKIK